MSASAETPASVEARQSDQCIAKHYSAISAAVHTAYHRRHRSCVFDVVLDTAEPCGGKPSQAKPSTVQTYLLT